MILDAVVVVGAVATILAPPPAAPSAVPGAETPHGTIHQSTGSLQTTNLIQTSNENIMLATKFFVLL